MRFSSDTPPDAFPGNCRWRAASPVRADYDAWVEAYRRFCAERGLPAAPPPVVVPIPVVVPTPADAAGTSVADALRAVIDAGDPDRLRLALTDPGVAAALHLRPWEILAPTGRLLASGPAVSLDLWLDFLTAHGLPLVVALAAALERRDVAAMDRVLPRVPDLNAPVPHWCAFSLALMLISPVALYDTCPIGDAIMEARLAEDDGTLVVTERGDRDREAEAARASREAAAEADWNYEQLCRLVSLGYTARPMPGRRVAMFDPLTQAILHHAPLRVITTLIAAGAPLDADGDDPTDAPLWYAAAWRNGPALTALLDAGARPDPLFTEGTWFRFCMPDDLPPDGAPLLALAASGRIPAGPPPEAYRSVYAVLDRIPWTPARLDAFLAVVLGDMAREPSETDRAHAACLAAWPRLSPTQRARVRAAVG